MNRPADGAGGVPRRQGGDVTVVLAYANSRRLAMASLGYQIVHRLFNSLEGVLCLRLFLPEGGLAPGSAPRTFDHPRDAARADWLAFSLAYENDYLNLLAMLRAAGLPLLSKDRRDGQALVVVGGIAPSLNPEPLADVADMFLIGEAEEALPGLVSAYRRERDRGAGREEILLALAQIPGVYAPRFYHPAYGDDGRLQSFAADSGVPPKVLRLFAVDLDAHAADSEARDDESGFGDMVLVEVGRGCGRGCRFCAAGFFYRPVRYRSREMLVSVIEKRLAQPARIGLLGASVFDHPAIGEVISYLAGRGCPFSVSSVRADALNDAALEAMAAGGLKTITMAPETGTERLRAVIGKSLSDESIINAGRRAVAAGIANLKLYFMVGLPGETKEDVDGIVDLVKKIRHAVVAQAKSRGTLGNISLSLSCYVPKAWTPFQWLPMAETAVLREKQKRLSSALAKIPNVRATHDVPRWAYIQAFLSRGDRRAARTLLAALDHGGDWRRAFAESAVNPDFVVRRRREKDELLPWDFVDTGIRKEYLWHELEAAGVPAEP